MFLLRRPAAAVLDRFVERARDLPLSYAPVGLAQQTTPAGFRVDEAQGLLGHGQAVFDRAARLLAEWRGFDLGWAGIHPASAPVSPGTNVAVVATHLGFWSVHACRIVYLLESTREASVAGFAYGTLTEHAETGEEIFGVSLDRGSGAVTYFIRAVSRERALLARVGAPVARGFQRRFRRDSVAAMRRHLAAPAT